MSARLLLLNSPHSPHSPHAPHAPHSLLMLKLQPLPPLLLLLVPLLLLAQLSACSAPPRPTPVDPSARHPVNSSEAIQAQVCQGALQSARQDAVQSARAASVSAATLDHLLARQRALARALDQALKQALSQALDDGPTQAQPRAKTLTPPQALHPPVDARAAESGLGNAVYALQFEFGSTQLRLPDPDAQTLLERARAAPLILLRGRTDGRVDTAAERRIARDRAWAVRDFLVAGGIDAARIRATYQAVGDPVADNSTARGRQLNRRVEVELYEALPTQLQLSTVLPRPQPQEAP